MRLAAGLMLVGCGMMTTSVPTIITAGLTGTLPGASDYRSTSGVWTQQHAGIGRVLLSDSGSSAASGTCSHPLVVQGAARQGGGGGGVGLVMACMIASGASNAQLRLVLRPRKMHSRFAAICLYVSGCLGT